MTLTIDTRDCGARYEAGRLWLWARGRRGARRWVPLGHCCTDGIVAFAAKLRADMPAGRSTKIQRGAYTITLQPIVRRRLDGAVFSVSWVTPIIDRLGRNSVTHSRTLPAVDAGHLLTVARLLEALKRP